MKVKSTLARTVLAGGVTIAALGMGAGIAVAEPEQSSPGQQDQQSQQAQQGQSQQQGQQGQQAQPQQPGQQGQQLPQSQQQHGFSLFGTWIPLPF
ncbi:hypothetical protein [Nocardia aurantia]|uniref:Uncharacterized protein n=1 Tax=Nocardia aurantia TaxID=2585199 RepID=A0A7K0DKT1_9NOCA|nr:hypothetical protein [Nocardia aurantia]MQY26386.1 hypothetical protein [Nocardia aurantia]